MSDDWESFFLYYLYEIPTVKYSAGMFFSLAVFTQLNPDKSFSLAHSLLWHRVKDKNGLQMHADLVKLLGKGSRV